MRQRRIPPVGERIGEASQVVRGESGCIVRGSAQRERGQIGDQVEIAEAQGPPKVKRSSAVAASRTVVSLTAWASV
jgi:hypothetical protein